MLGHPDYFAWWLAIGFSCGVALAEAIRPADAVALAMMALPGTATLMSGTGAAPVAIVAGRSVLALLSRITLTRTPEQDTRGTRRGTKRYVGLTLRVLCRLVRRSNRRCRTVGDRSEPVREDNTGTFTNKIRFPVIISCSQLAAQEKNANFHSVVYRPLLLFSIVVSAVYRTPSWSGRRSQWSQHRLCQNRSDEYCYLTVLDCSD
jgi:hypothetical protein